MVSARKPSHFGSNNSRRLVALAFSGDLVDFGSAEFTTGELDFLNADFSGGRVKFLAGA